MKDMETIWWKTQAIHPTTKEPIGNPTLYVKLAFDNTRFKNVYSTEILHNVNDTKKEMINNIINALEEGYNRVEQEIGEQIWNS